MCFPKATLINDRFHVQQFMSEAIDRMRIRLRWQVLEEEIQTLKEHRDRRKAARNKEEREAMGHRERCRMVNGETMPQIRPEAGTSSSNTYPNGTYDKGADLKCFSSNFQN